MHRKGNAYYYVANTLPRKWIPLGSDIVGARLKWIDLENASLKDVPFTLDDISQKYFQFAVKTLAPRTFRDYSIDYVPLSKVFGHMSLDQITRLHLVEFRDQMGEFSRFTANRCRAVLASIWTFALDKAITECPNIVLTVKKLQVENRDRYVTDDEFSSLLSSAPKCLSLLLHFSYLTGQRPADVRELKVSQVSDEYISIVQGKTKKALRISITGELRELVKTIHDFRKTSVSEYFFVDENGLYLTQDKIRKRFDKARIAAGVSFRLVDLRAKAATDMQDFSLAQKLLGHTNPNTTKIYRRDKRGEIVDPVR